MSEYQYYEFVAIDRPLTPQEQKKVRALSSRATVTARRFVNEYSYGDFRGSPEQLMEQYYDAHLYQANWGTNTLMLRLPRASVNVDLCRRYLDNECNGLKVTDEYVIFEFHSNLEGGEGWLEPDSKLLRTLVSLRKRLQQGDLRCLYLAWLSSLTDMNAPEDDEAIEPPVPAGLKKLDGVLKTFAQFMRVDKDILKLAARASPDLTGERGGEADLRAWLGQQTAVQKDMWLLQLLSPEGGEVRRRVLTAFRSSLPGPRTNDARRTIGQLREPTSVEEVVDKPIPETTWQQVERQVARKNAGGYREAMNLLRQARQGIVTEPGVAAFLAQVRALAKRHEDKKAFVRQLSEAGWLDG